MNNLSAEIKLSKTKLHTMEHLGELLGGLLGPLLITCLPLIKMYLTH